VLLWEVLRSFTNAQRALFLRFVWGRSRLPATASDFERPFTVTPLGGHYAVHDPDVLLPQAHTCFFRLILPPWRTLKAARERLIFAITNCSAMDTDFDASAPDVSTRNAWRGL
jgi:hypothetical protein